MDNDEDLLIQAFTAQSEEGVSRMEESLIHLEAHPEDEEALHEIFRICHTLKGDSSIVGFSSLAEFAHHLEDLLEGVRNHAIPVTGQLVTLLLESVDALRELLRDALDGRDGESTKHTALLERLRNQSGSEQDVRSGEREPDDSPLQSLNGLEGASASSHNQTLRVRVETIDRLLNLTGELAVARSRIQQLFMEIASTSSGELLEAHEATNQIFASLQQEMMKVRMVPIGPIFRQHHRTVRDLATAEGKRVRLAIEGEKAELDMAVTQQLREPLGHMVRNAVAHGIETPEAREACGKDPCGCVTLRAWHEGASIIVEVADDGAGLDWERIRERARAMGIAADPDSLDESALTELLFEPGFSTADEATLASGRGVGMDVVNRNIEALQGSVSIESSLGAGTVVTIRLPLTLAIMDGFAVGVGKETYVISLPSVVECLDLPQANAQPASASGLLNHRGKSLPYVRLRDALGMDGEVPERQKIVVIQHDGAEAGVAVDALLGERQIVIKPLDSMFRDLPGIGGATILGDGQVALILDVPALLRRSVGWQTGGGNRRRVVGDTTQAAAETT